MASNSELEPPALTPARVVGVAIRGALLAALVGYSSWVLGAFIVANVHLGAPVEAATQQRPDAR